MELLDRVAEATGVPAIGAQPMAGGCVAEVVCVELADRCRVVVKHGGKGYCTEAMMLRMLGERSDLPVPRVVHDEPDLLILEYIESDGRVTSDAELHAAELLAGLHGVRGESFGFACDTLIGPLDQPCQPSLSWVEFFAAHRLRHFGAIASKQGAITPSCWYALQRLADRLGAVLDEPEHPSLIHGDVWGGNVLCRDGRVAAFLDPATHYAHPEVELAFITLFSTFGRVFFDRYHELRPIRDGFFETRRHVYNLYPLLVHAILFGGGYGRQVDTTLTGLTRSRT